MRKLVSIQDWEYTGYISCAMCRAYNGTEPCLDEECDWSRYLCRKFLKTTASPVFQSEE